MPTFFLGAGASREAGLPLAEELTNRVIAGVDPEHRPFLEFVRSAKQTQQTTFVARELGVEYRPPVDAETLFSVVGDLVHRETLDLAPFVATWHPFLATASPTVNERDIEKMLVNTFAQEDERDFKGLARVLARLNSSDSLPESILLQMQDAAMDAVTVDPAATDYLKPLTDFVSAGRGDVTIATLNYDLAIETLLDRARLPWSDGLPQTGSSQLRRVLEFQPGAVRVYKLHGSSNWYSDGQSSAVVKRPEKIRSRVLRPSIRFAGVHQPTAEWPFPDLFWGWRESLRERNNLVVIGYSFRDEHVNAAISGWLGADNSRKLYILDPRFAEPESPAWECHPLAQYLKTVSTDTRSHRAKAASSPTGFAYVEGPPPDPRIVIIREPAGRGLVQLRDLLLGR